MNFLSRKILAQLRPCITRQRQWLAHHRLMTSQVDGDNNTHVTNTQFDEKMLEVLACPLTKKPLRYDKDTNELISDSIQVAFPIVNGIPNLVPQDGRMMKEPVEKKT